MATRTLWIAAALALSAASGFSQAPPESFPTMKQLMVDLIHPASNELLLLIYRGGPKDDSEWAAARRSAMTLAESGNLLAARSREEAWTKNAKMLADAGAAAYKAAQAADGKALAALAESLDAPCTGCHKQYRPNVFSRGGSK